MIFAEILQELREDKNISRKELASILNISISTLGMYEQGRREPNIDMLIKIADYFSVSLDFLVGRKSIQTKDKILTEAITFKKQFDKLPSTEKDIIYYILKIHNTKKA